MFFTYSISHDSDLNKSPPYLIEIVPNTESSLEEVKNEHLLHCDSSSIFHLCHLKTELFCILRRELRKRIHRMAPQKKNCAVLGCTGSVGQRFILLLADHPTLKLHAVCIDYDILGKYQANIDSDRSIFAFCWKEVQRCCQMEAGQSYVDRIGRA